MIDILTDLHKASDVAVHNRRESARRLAGLWLVPEISENIDQLIKIQKAVEAIDAAIAHEESLVRSGPVTVLNDILDHQSLNADTADEK